MDVGGWLRGLGLGQFEKNFRDNKIDADLLPRLTNDDLKDIGVSALGDRRRLLDAIAALAGAGAKTPADVSVSTSKPVPPKGPAVSAERRPITVMFCDLVRSTGLAAKLDPEDWRSLVKGYLDEASGALTGVGGHVLKRLGDGLMAWIEVSSPRDRKVKLVTADSIVIETPTGSQLKCRRLGREHLA
jgi:class 3 adenylate cyclase